LYWPNVIQRQNMDGRKERGLIMLYLCKWSSGLAKYLEWEDFKKVNEQYFTDDNGYEEIHRLMIGKLRVGDTIDLSDGISQYHEVERIS